jgi:5-methylthioadenosine/S-adenosylhomocysteine deaminase
MGTTCAHCVWLEEEDMTIMAAAGATVVHNPFSNIRLGSGIAALSDYAAQGVNVCLGADGSCSSDGQDILEVVRPQTLNPKF